MIRVSPDISRIAPYVPGKPIEELEREFGITGAVKMASNENPLGPSKMAVRAIRKQLKQIFRYPNGAAYLLKRALADKWKVRPEQIIIGNGSNEIIELLVRTFILAGDEVVMAEPSFSLYRLMAQSGHATVRTVPLKEGRHDLAGMAKAVTAKTKIVFVCNPNNPTGTIIDHKALKKFLAALPKRILVVCDEAYAEYAGHPDFPLSVSLLKEGASIIVLRTFSKIYGLAGLRVGYGLSHPTVIDYMNRVRQPFNTNLPAQLGALAALSDEAHVSRSLKINAQGKRSIAQNFDRMGIFYYPSEANFIFFDLQGFTPLPGNKIQNALLTKGVIIRHFGGTQFRVSIGLPAENRRFIQALKEVLASKKKSVHPKSDRAPGGAPRP